MGVAPSSDTDKVLDIVDIELKRIGCTAEILEIRHGTLVLSAPPQTAALLRFDTDRLLSAIATAVPGTISSIRIRTTK